MKDLIEQLTCLKQEAEKVERMCHIPLNLQQTAAYLGVSVSTVQNYVHRGMIRKKVSNGLAGYMINDISKLI